MYEIRPARLDEFLQVWERRRELDRVEADIDPHIQYGLCEKCYLGLHNGRAFARFGHAIDDDSLWVFVTLTDDAAPHWTEITRAARQYLEYLTLAYPGVPIRRLGRDAPKYRGWLRLIAMHPETYLGDGLAKYVYTGRSEPN